MLTTEQELELPWGGVHSQIQLGCLWGREMKIKNPEKKTSFPKKAPCIWFCSVARIKKREHLPCSSPHNHSVACWTPTQTPQFRQIPGKAYSASPFRGAQPHLIVFNEKSVKGKERLRLHTGHSFRGTGGSSKIQQPSKKAVSIPTDKPTRHPSHPARLYWRRKPYHRSLPRWCRQATSDALKPTDHIRMKHWAGYMMRRSMKNRLSVICTSGSSDSSRMTCFPIHCRGGMTSTINTFALEHHASPKFVHHTRPFHHRKPPSADSWKCCVYKKKSTHFFLKVCGIDWYVKRRSIHNHTLFSTYKRFTVLIMQLYN